MRKGAMWRNPLIFCLLARAKKRVSKKKKNETILSYVHSAVDIVKINVKQRRTYVETQNKKTIVQNTLKRYVSKEKDTINLDTRELKCRTAREDTMDGTILRFVHTADEIAKEKVQKKSIHTKEKHPNQR